MSRVLVTGGAGFIGSHLIDALVARGDDVRILDNLDVQAHPQGAPGHLRTDAELIVGDLRDRGAVGRALDGVEVVFHQAGMVGNGQSMYDIAHYIDVNARGTAILMEEVLRRRDRVRRLVAASSMVVYGEGAYRCPEHGPVAPGLRRQVDLQARRWEPTCPICTGVLEATATTEDWPLHPTSPYAISKRDCEEIVLTSAAAHGLEAIALRYLNVYGPRQALSNPYSGVAAIFCTRLMHGRPPMVFEDGDQLRDLVHVSDVVRANLLAMDAPLAPGHAINVGTGSSISVLGLATCLAEELGIRIEPNVTGEFRAGDIRHCWADIGSARQLLGFCASTLRSEGLRELCEWVRTQSPADRTDAAIADLRERQLIQ